MQINVPPIPAFQIPGTTGTVVGVSNVIPNKPVREEGDEGGGSGGTGGGGAGSGAETEQRDNASSTERRDVDRRSGQDRRKQQITVLLDTRVGERRRSQRREEDPAPAAVDFRV